jgi:hypothetical protein
MRTKQLLAGAVIVGGVGLNLVGLHAMVVIADASPPVVSNEPDPSGPNITIEPAPSAPSPDIAVAPGVASSTDTGSDMPGGSLSDPNVGGPSPTDAGCRGSQRPTADQGNHRSRRTLTRVSVLPPRRRLRAALRQRDPPTPPALHLPTLRRRLGQLRLPVSHPGRPQTWVMAAGRRDARNRPPRRLRHPHAIARSVLAGYVRLLGVHPAPTVAVLDAATTAGLSASSTAPIRWPDGIPRL